MNERSYLFLVGAYILAALYFDIKYMIYGLVVFLLFEGITGIRLTTLLQKSRKIKLDHGLAVLSSKKRFNAEALSAWRVLVALVLASTYALMHEYGIDLLWFFPWFMGFSIMGAGASGVCPMLLSLRWAGFR